MSQEKRNSPLIIASNNSEKLHEMQSAVGDNVRISSYSVYYPREIHFIENGNTYEENARIKAQAVSKRIHQSVVGDDGGLHISSLPNLFGLHTAREFPKGLSSEEKNQFILEQIRDVPQEYRKFELHCTLVYVNPQKEKDIVVHKSLSGEIATAARGKNGFGFDSILFLPDYGHTLAELSDYVRQTLSPRAQAIQKLVYLIKGE